MAAFLLTVAGCSKFKVGSFVMPSWDTQLSAPMFYHTYSLWDMLSKDSVKVSGTDTTYLNAVPPSYTFTLLRSQNLNGVQVGNNLKIASVPTVTASQSPSDFAIEQPNPVNYALVDAALPVNTTGTVPAIPQQNPTLSPNKPFGNFKSVTLSSGTITVSLHNGYPAPVTFSSTGLTIKDSLGNVVMRIPISPNPLPANQTTVLHDSLAGVVFPNNPRISFTYSSAGASSGFFGSDTVVAVAFDLTNLHVSSAVAVVPPQKPFTINKSIVLTDGNKVTTADIQSGTLSLSITNQFQVPDTIDLVLKSIISQTNSSDTLRTRFVLPPSTNNYPVTLNLAGYKLNMGDQFGNPTDSLLYRITATMPGSRALPDSFVTVSTSQSVQSSFTLSNLQLSSFTGLVRLQNPITLSTDTQNVNLGDFGKKFSGAIEFGPSTQLALNINSIGFPCEAHITLIPASSADLSSPPVDSAVVDTIIYPNKTNQVILGPSFVAALNKFAQVKNTIPDRFIISGYVVVNPTAYATTGTVKSTDEVTGSATISMPFDLGIINAIYVDTTKTALISDSSTAAKMANVDTGSVTMEIWNGLPLQVTLFGQLIDTTTHAVIMNFPSDSVVIPPADINSDGTVRDSVFSRNTIGLGNAQARNLGNAYMRFSFRVATPSGSQTVPFTKNNTISLKVYGNFSFKVDKNLTGK